MPKNKGKRTMSDQNEKLLVVEDTFLIAMQLQMDLKSLGYSVAGPAPSVERVQDPGSGTCQGRPARCPPRERELHSDREQTRGSRHPVPVHHGIRTGGGRFQAIRQPHPAEEADQPRAARHGHAPAAGQERVNTSQAVDGLASASQPPELPDSMASSSVHLAYRDWTFSCALDSDSYTLAALR